MRPDATIRRALLANDGGLLDQVHGAAALRHERLSAGPHLESNHQGAPKEGPDAGSLITRRLSDIEPEPIRWLWPRRIARGKLTIIAGDPGLGKSLVTASIAAVVTTGGRWPVDRTRCTPPGVVLFLTAEDDAADTLRPRLEAAGADLSRIHIIEGVIAGYTGDGARRSKVFSLQEDLPGLAATLEKLGEVAAVIIDPISAYLGGTDSHKNADVRGLLAPLSALAAQHSTAIIGVAHLTKAEGKQAMMRVSGSLAFVAAARAAYLVGADRNDKSRRLFVPMKNNLGPDATGLAYRIEAASIQSKAGPLETSLVSWESEPVPITADEVMQSGTPQRASALSEAKDWFDDTLIAGPMPVAEIFEKAGAEAISERTIRRAKKELGITPQKDGMKGGWLWSLQPKVAKPPEDDQVSELATFEEIGHLREAEGRVVEAEV